MAALGGCKQGRSPYGGRTLRFDEAKAFPHPVLRHGSSDYPDAEFQAQLNLVRRLHGSGVQLSARFDLSEPALLELIEMGLAHYTLILSCSRTHYRISWSTAERELEQDIPSGKLRGLAELFPFVVASSEILEFRADGWHEDFLHMGPLDISPGTVLAADSQKAYFIDNAEEAPIGSIFETKESSNVMDGCWECSLDGERVEILLSSGDHARLTNARRRVANTSDSAYLMNGVWLPALHHVLVLADASAGEYDGRRWFRALDKRLSDVQCRTLGSTVSADRLRDAQRLLEYPFGSLPVLHDGFRDG